VVVPYNKSQFIYTDKNITNSDYMNKLDPKKMHSQNLNFLKNSFQFVIGSALFFAIMKGFSLFNFLIGLIGFVIAYNAVYQFNDLVDYEEDKNDGMRKYYKPLVTGKLNKRQMKIYGLLCLIIGLPMCFFVSMMFGSFVVIILFLNFLHSSPFIRLKKSSLVLPNLFFIEFIKFSLGWFALSSSMANFPYLFISLSSIVYLMAYIYYKQNVSGFFRNKKIVTLGIVSSALYIASVFVYPFKLALIAVLPMFLVFSVFRKYKYNLLRIKIGTNILGLIIIFFVFSLLFLSVPSVAKLNNEISNKIDVIKENISENVPVDIKYRMASLEKTIKENINDIERITDMKISYQLG
jgi:4-hydroxybenzoate polyprenyltransferase